jgi:Zn-dependent M28 family amino/carboxypeptidase
MTAFAAAVAMCTALVGAGGAVPAVSAAVAPPGAEQVQVAENHGIPDLIDLVKSLREEGKISAFTYAGLLDRLEHALREERKGSEVRPLGYLNQFIARVNNQVRDAGARAELVAAAQYAVSWLQLEDQAEISGSKQLQEDVTLDGVMRHLRALQQIADENDGNRFAGSPGHMKSTEYVHDLLEDAGYDVSYQDFTYELSNTTFQQLTPDAKSYTEGPDFYTASGTGFADVTGQVVAVDVKEPTEVANANTSGCEASDFANFPAGAIALVQRGTCTFAIKAANAEAAGAKGVIIYNEGTIGAPDRQGPLNPTVEGSDVTIPVVGVPFALGRDLADPATTTVRIKTERLDVPTRNVIAETPGGNPDNIVMLGAHLDSVEAGPGINDNGSGSAAILETALQLAGKHVNNKVRFAWWSAEESGLLGSLYYTDNLSEAEADKIALYLNFDMVASPNYFRGVYDGSGTLGGTAPRPEGSAAIEELFNSTFQFKGLAFEDTPFDGRSDYQGFINNDIPSGGLFTGAEVRKTEAQKQRYGGVAGAAFDPCYHAACDSFTPVEDGADAATYAALQEAYGDQLVGNLNTFALDTSADAIAHAVATYAYSTASVNGVE